MRATVVPLLRHQRSFWSSSHALFLTAIILFSSNAFGRTTPSAPSLGLIVLPGEGSDTSMAREVREIFLRTFHHDREVNLIDTARRISAQPTRLSPSLRRHLQEGIFYLEKGQYRRAISTLKSVLREMHRRLTSIPKAAIMDASLHLAAAQLQAHRRRHALRTLVALLTWRRRDAFELRTSIPRGWEALLDQAKNVVTKKALGSLRVVSVPSQAETYLDGKRTGPTPAFIQNILYGTHYLTLRLAGYERTVLAVHIGPRSKTIAITLKARDKARELLTMLREMRDELGRPSVLFPDALHLDLGIKRAIIIVVTRRADKLRLHAYLYAIESGKLRGRSVVTTSIPPRIEQLMPLALWRITALPKDTHKGQTDKLAATKPFYKRWWFWAAVGAASAAGIIIPLAATASTDPGRADHFQLTW